MLFCPALHFPPNQQAPGVYYRIEAMFYLHLSSSAVTSIEKVGELGPLINHGRKRRARHRPGFAGLRNYYSMHRLMRAHRLPAVTQGTSQSSPVQGPFPQRHSQPLSAPIRGAFLPVPERAGLFQPIPVYRTTDGEPAPLGLCKETKEGAAVGHTSGQPLAFVLACSSKVLCSCMH